MATLDSTDSTATIQLTKGYSTVVDACDADLGEVKWYAFAPRKKLIYAGRTESYGDNRRWFNMHRVILERMIGRKLAKGEYPDHIDGNGLNNRRANLRLATNSQNMANVGLSKRNKSGFKGVCFEKFTGRWLASIHVNGKKMNLGRYDTPEEAHAVYVEAAKKYFGEFANAG